MPSLTVEELSRAQKAARLANLSRFRTVAKQYTPPNFKVEYRSTLKGARVDRAAGVIRVCEPKSPKSLLLYLTACGAAAGAADPHAWATARMREHGLPPPNGRGRAGPRCRRGAVRVDRRPSDPERFAEGHRARPDRLDALTPPAAAHPNVDQARRRERGLELARAVVEAVDCLLLAIEWGDAAACPALEKMGKAINRRVARIKALKARPVSG